MIIKEDIKLWINLFHSVARDLNINIRIGARYAYCIKLFLSEDSSPELEFDLLPNLSGGSRIVIQLLLIDRSHLHNDFIFKPSPCDEYIITLNHSFLHGGFYPSKYHEKLTYSIHSNLKQWTTNAKNIWRRHY